MKSIFPCLLCLCALALTPPVAAQKAARRNLSVSTTPEFTTGNIVVCRVGTGSGSLTSSAAAVFLDEYSSDGTLVSSIAMPTTNDVVQKAFTVAGTATVITECHLNRSADGRYLVLAGYPQVPGTGTVSGSAGARVIARVDSAGNVDTSTTTSSFGTSPIRGAASVDGSGFWVVGSVAGVVYMPLANVGVGTVVSNTITNLRAVNIFDGQLYTSSNSLSYRLGAVGTGTPSTGSNTSTNLPGFPTTGNPTAFYFADLTASVAGVDTLYVADDGTGTGSAGGGVKKFSLVSGTWTYNGTFPAAAGPPAIPATLFFGLTGETNGTQVTLYATRIATGNQLVRFVDTTGYNAAPTAVPTLLATAAANTSFRGVALAPVSPVVTPSLSIDDVSQSEGNAGTTAYTFTVTLSSPAPSGGVTFDIATADGTAQDDSPEAEDADYTPSSLTGQMIAAGATTYQFTVQVNGDGT